MKRIGAATAHAGGFRGAGVKVAIIDSGVDVVLLCEPPGFRPMHFKAAVDAGKHVFMEKPVAVDATGIRSVIAAPTAIRLSLIMRVSLCNRHSRLN